MSIYRWPELINWKRGARNGYEPSAQFYNSVAQSINHATAFRRREIYSRAWELGNTSGSSGTVNLCRFRFRSGYGVSRLRFFVMMGLDDLCAAVTPSCEIAVTESGGSTTNLDPIYYGHQCASTDDPPVNCYVGERTASISSATTYEVLVNAVSYARILSIVAFEEASLVVSESTPYYTTVAADAGAPIFDSHRERLLTGAVAMYKQGAGTLVHWGSDTIGGSPPNIVPHTRSSATLINLIDNATTGAPTTATKGVYIDNTNRYTYSRTTVPYELAVYGSIPSGSGTVRLTGYADGTDRITVTVNNATPQWFTATGSLPNTSDKYDLRYNGDGSNTISVYATSLIEYEA